VNDPDSVPEPALASVPAAPPARRRRRRAHETAPARDGELLEVAAAMFRERGYADTAISDIAEALGIAKGSVYHYIRSKEDLLYRVCMAVHEDGNRVLRGAEEFGGSALERLEHYVRELTASNARNVVKIAVYYVEFRHLTGERRADIERERTAHGRFVRRLIDEAREAGEIDAAAPSQVIAANVLAQIVWPYTWYRTGKALSPEALGAAVAGLAIDGLAKRSLDR
jgi:TetR/AcrR family transcriptional regulator, cholesterol catabolism regulator